MAEVLTASFGLQAAPAGGEQRDFTFRNRRRGEVASMDVWQMHAIWQELKHREGE